jgi:hypothetical protein
MLVTIKIDIRPFASGPVPSAPTSGKEAFWSNFDEADRQLKLRPDRPGPPPSPRTATELEESFKSNFPRELEARLREPIESARRERPKRRRLLPWRRAKIPPRFEIKLVSLEYGSIRALFEFWGLTNEDVRNVLLAALQFYIPPAFRAALGTEVPIEPTVYADLAGGTAPTQQTGSSRAAEIVQPVATFLANLFLIVPVALALGICYYAFDGLLKQFEGLRNETEKFRTEREDIVKALIDQNKNIAATIIDNAKSSMANAQASQRLLVTLVMQKTIDQDGKKDDSEKVKKIVDTKNEQPTANVSYNICFAGEEGSRRTHSNPRFTSSGRLKRAALGNLLELCPSAGK